jgi:hypothetical protein
LPLGHALFDLALGLQEQEGDLVGVFNYAIDLFDHSTVERWAENFRLVVNELIDHPEARLSEINLPEVPAWSTGDEDDLVPSEEVPYDPPSGGVEQVLASIWEDVLGVERVGRHDHFFALGGHSLRAVQVVARVCSYLDTDVPLRLLFERPTLSAFAEGIIEKFIESHEIEEVTLESLFREPPRDGDPTDGAPTGLAR